MGDADMDQELRDLGFTDDQIAQAHLPISTAEMDAYEEGHKDDADRQFYRDRDKRRQADAAIGPERENELLTEAPASATRRGGLITNLRRQVKGRHSARELDQLSTDAAWARGFEACLSAVNADMADAWDQGRNAAMSTRSDGNPYRAARTPSHQRPAMDVLKASDNVTQAAPDGRS